MVGFRVLPLHEYSCTGDFPNLSLGQPFALHLHMLVLDGVYVANDCGGLRFQRVKAPSVDELKALVHAISHRVARFLEKRGFLERDAEFGRCRLRG
jgi:hypothetical protein